VDFADSGSVPFEKTETGRCEKGACGCIRGDSVS